MLSDMDEDLYNIGAIQNGGYSGYLLFGFHTTDVFFHYGQHLVQSSFETNCYGGTGWMIGWDMDRRSNYEMWYMSFAMRQYNSLMDEVVVADNDDQNVENAHVH